MQKHRLLSAGAWILLLACLSKLAVADGPMPEHQWYEDEQDDPCLQGGGLGPLAEAEEEVRGIRLGVDLARGDGHSAAHSYIGERFPA